MESNNTNAEKLMDRSLLRKRQNDEVLKLIENYKADAKQRKEDRESMNHFLIQWEDLVKMEEEAKNQTQQLIDEQEKNIEHLEQLKKIEAETRAFAGNIPADINEMIQHELVDQFCVVDLMNDALRDVMK